MTFLLILTCANTPMFIAFHEDGEEISNWTILNIVIDIFFAIDIVVMFLTAFYNDDFHIIDDTKIIARNYLFGWFLLDVLAITPFD